MSSVFVFSASVYSLTCFSKKVGIPFDAYQLHEIKRIGRITPLLFRTSECTCTGNDTGTAHK